MTRLARQDVARVLRERRRQASPVEAPRVFDVSVPADADALAALLETTPNLQVQDELTRQIAELVHARHPIRKRDDRLDAEVAERFLAGRDPEAYGVWVHYPWRNALVHLLPKHEFVELRTARNQLHLTPAQQVALRTKTIGIVGLSVGYSMAVTMALEGVGGRFRLADFDRLELSNTNRLGTGVTGLGHNKAALAARTMLEIDPFLEIEVFERGVHADNVLDFFQGERALDVLIEECDDLPMKLRLREIARDLAVPVICETSQRGILDVERFDLEPTRPPFHGLMGPIVADELARLTTREKAPFLLSFMQGAKSLSPSLAASLVEIERSLAGWPQLASDVTLGGAVVTSAARRLLLGSLQRSGRFQVDVDAIVSDEAEGNLRTALAPTTEIEAPPPVEPSDRRPSVPAVDPVTPKTVANLLPRWVQWASLVPSGGNVQPWAFHEQEDGSLHCRLSVRGQGSALDPDRFAARMSCAATFTNLEIAAARDGFRTEVTWQPVPNDPELLYACRFFPEAGMERDPLTDFVTSRCTNRRVTPREPLGVEAVDALRSEARRWDGELIVHDQEASLDRVGRVLGELERVRMFSLPFYREMMGELTDQHAAPQGVALETLELQGADAAALEILRRREVVDLLHAEGRGDALLELAHKPVRHASAVCMLHVSGNDAQAALRGGLALQRVWLRATEQNIAVQPVSAGLYMLQQLRDERARARLDPWARAELARLQPAFEDCFRVPTDRTAVLVFRVFRAPPPSARSARLPVDAVLHRSVHRHVPARPAQRRAS